MLSRESLTHSHMAIEGGGNETTSPITPNVRIADVIRDDDITIYLADEFGFKVSTLHHVLGVDATGSNHDN